MTSFLAYAGPDFLDISCLWGHECLLTTYVLRRSRCFSQAELTWLKAMPQTLFNMSDFVSDTLLFESQIVLLSQVSEHIGVISLHFRGIFFCRPFSDTRRPILVNLQTRRIEVI